MPLGLLNNYSLINRASPLNNGLISWWMGLPIFGTSNKFYDLIKRYNINLNTGTRLITSLRKNSNFVINSDADANHYGSVNCTAITGYPFTLSCWSQSLGNNGSNRACVSISFDTSTYADIGWSSTNGVPLLGISNTSFLGIQGSAVGLNKWTHIVGVYTSATSRDLYINGKFVVNGSTNVSSFSSSTIFLNKHTSVAATGLFDTDDIRIFNRALLSSEILKMYQDSLMGYPNTLNYQNNLQLRPISYSNFLLQYNNLPNYLGLNVLQGL